jgi:DNA replication ATP-dependent helicase Dna2
MGFVHGLIDKLLESPAVSVTEAGEQLLAALSAGQLGRDAFLNDPLALVGPPYFASRYLAQVTLRTVKGEYETLEEVVASLSALIERNPPILEPKRQATADRVVLPEAKVLDLRYPVKVDGGVWESSIDALVTSGPFRDSEVRIRIRSDQNRPACFLVPHLWIHSAIAAYNLAPLGDGDFAACAETFFVLEPMRQVNATSIARSLHCTKPQLDQLRRGKGDVTIHTLKGQLVHSLFDRMLEGASNMESAYREVLPGFLVALASVTDEFFDEDAFRADVLRHIGSLEEFIERNPHLLEHSQLELKRYSATIGIQGRIDAVFRAGNRIDILELKTGARIRPEDHAQLFIYRLLLSDLVRRWQRNDGQDVEVTSRLLSSVDGSFAPLRVTTDFYQVLDARNKLIAMQYAVGRNAPHIAPRHEGFNEQICGSCPSWTRNRCKEMSDVFGDRPGASESSELEYFRRFTSLVQRERWSADQEVADLLDDSRLEFRVKSFRTICGVRVVPGAEPFTFEYAENTSDLERGDSVLIHAGRISSTSTYHGYVREIDTRRMRVSIPLKNLDTSVFEGQDWIVDRFPSDVTAEASHTALYDFLVAPMNRKKAVNLGTRAKARDYIGDQMSAGNAPSPNVLAENALAANALAENVLSPNVVAGFSRRSLNFTQREAIDRAVNCDVFHLIWGPPGTGKTRVIPEIVERINGPVLLGAFTNTAVDKMLIALLDHDPSTRFLRVGRASDSPEVAAKLQGDPAEFFTENLALKYGSVHAVKEALQRTNLVAATAHRASTIPYLRSRSFEMAIVDEAGQLTEPLTLGLILRARRFVLIGDDRQLPPVVRTRGLAHSMFERLKKDSGAITLLDTQYRMHPQIMDISNRLFYGGRLRAGITGEERRPPDGLPVVFIPVESRRDGRSNPEEAGVVVDIVRSLTRDFGVAPESIGVVSPFRAQVVLLRQMLNGVGVAVDTVERFQGGERDIMILSFVRSRGTGFVFDDRRLNVAITRARRKLVLVAHPELFQKSRYAWICTFTETLKTAGTI